MDGRGFPCFERDFAGAGQGLGGRGAPVGGRGPGEPLPARTGCRQALPPRSANTPAGPPSGRTGLPLVPGPAPPPPSDNVGRGAGGAQWPLSPTPQVDGGSAGHVRKPLLHRLGTGPRSHAARGCDQAGFSATATLPSPWSPKAVPLPSVSVLASGCKPGQLLARERAGSGCCVHRGGLAVAGGVPEMEVSWGMARTLHLTTAVSCCQLQEGPSPAEGVQGMAAGRRPGGHRGSGHLAAVEQPGGRRRDQRSPGPPWGGRGPQVHRGALFRGLRRPPEV